MYASVPACQITTYYYVGFAYMMMRRYQDAIRTFSNILLYIQRAKQMFENKTSMYDTVSMTDAYDDANVGSVGFPLNLKVSRRGIIPTQTLSFVIVVTLLI